ncbi:ribonuclease [Thraustotheca clavata]|uniref:ribonuclease H n=1 Tax=Thraustotheca clavata TaxID=74557 RepID=A0A1W0A571_9STRA|nr:ribonuclease [Thraustotheca clavata]
MLLRATVEFFPASRNHISPNLIPNPSAERRDVIKPIPKLNYRNGNPDLPTQQKLKTTRIAKQNNKALPDPKDPNTLVAFCDGSAINNGKHRCKAAFACVFPHNEDRNVASNLPTDAKATNNRAEYMAALEAMKRANIEDPSQNQVLYIFSDSMLLIRSMTEWLPTWIKNNWVKDDGERVKNDDLLKQLKAVQGTRKILWQHVKAHTNRKDWKSIWNDKVDQLARSTALR